MSTTDPLTVLAAGPRRIQLRRSKGWRKPEGAVVVARPSKWGNPFKVGGTYGNHPSQSDHPMTRDEVVALYRRWIDRGIAGYDFEARVRSELGGRDLACWCPLEDEHGNRVPCHADVLLEIANTAVASTATKADTGQS